MSMAAGARAGARLLQLRSSTPFLRSQTLPSPVDPSKLTTSRAFSADHGPARVNIWEDPTSPSKWKEEHFVFVSLAGWFFLFYGGYKAATGSSKPKLAGKVELPPKSVAKAEPVSRKKDDSVSRKEGKPAPRKKEEMPAPKKNEEKADPKKQEKLVIKKEDETPAPKRKVVRLVPKKKEDKEVEQSSRVLQSKDC